MSNKENIKRRFALQERDKLLDLVGAIDTVIASGIEETESRALLERMKTQFAFTQSINWLKSSVDGRLPDIEHRIDGLATALEAKFPWPDETSNLKQLAERVVKQIVAQQVTQLFLDTSLVLYILGWNGPAIIELHSVLEREAIEELVVLLFQPDKIEIGYRVMGRRTLQELAPLLQECGVLDDDDIKFVQRLGKLRNGLAHKNAQLISNVVFSGKEIGVGDIDWAISNVDYIPLAIDAICLLMKVKGIEREILDMLESTTKPEAA